MSHPKIIIGQEVADLVIDKYGHLPDMYAISKPIPIMVKLPQNKSKLKHYQDHKPWMRLSK